MTITDAEIIRRWDAGETMTRIAEDAGLSRERIRQRLEPYDRGGPNRNSLPSAEELTTAAKLCTSISELAAHLKITSHRVNLALDKAGVREDIMRMLAVTQERAAEEQRRRTQLPYIQKIHALAAAHGHTPTQGELARIGIYHVTLNRLFGSVQEAMRASGLEPNVAGRPPMPLPPSFGQEFEPTCDDEELGKRVHTLRRLGIAHVPTGNPCPERTQRTSYAFYRDPAVVAWVLDEAQGVCEVCGKPGYETDDGSLFLEVHHVIPLSDGGPDVPGNLAAVCETCHGRLHRGKDRDNLRERLYATVPRLIASN